MNGTNREVHEFLGKVARLVIRERQSFPNEGLRLNVVFNVPGHFFQPDFSGVLATRMDRRRAYVLVMVAVPDDLSEPSFVAFAQSTLQTAATRATEYATHRRTTFDSSQLIALVEKVSGEIARLEA
jgi:hypothetical protein